MQSKTRVTKVRMKQKTLFKLSDYTSEHGGELSRGKRKSRRPLSLNLPHHFILSAETSESGSLVRHRNEVLNCLYEMAKRFSVTLHEQSVNSNHSHLMISFPSRSAYLGFIRLTTATLTRKIKVKWKLTPYSRMVHWGKEFESVRVYIERNEYEARGLTVYKR